MDIGNITRHLAQTGAVLTVRPHNDVFGWWVAEFGFDGKSGVGESPAEALAALNAACAP